MTTFSFTHTRYKDLQIFYRIIPNRYRKFIAKADNITFGELLDIWAEEELKVGTLNNGTVENYLGNFPL